MKTSDVSDRFSRRTLLRAVGASALVGVVVPGVVAAASSVSGQGVTVTLNSCSRDGSQYVGQFSASADQTVQQGTQVRIDGSNKATLNSAQDSASFSASNSSGTFAVVITRGSTSSSGSLSCPAQACAVTASAGSGSPRCTYTFTNGCDDSAIVSFNKTSTQGNDLSSLNVAGSGSASVTLTPNTQYSWSASVNGDPAGAGSIDCGHPGQGQGVEDGHPGRGDGLEPENEEEAE